MRASLEAEEEEKKGEQCFIQIQTLLDNKGNRENYCQSEWGRGNAMKEENHVKSCDTITWSRMGVSNIQVGSGL